MFEAFRLTGSILFDTSNAVNNLRNFSSMVEKTGDKLKKIGSTVSGAGQAMTKLVTVPVLGAVGAMIKGASDLNETLSKTEVVFGKASDEVKAWSDTTLKKVGLAKGTALDMAAVYGDMGSAMGLNAKQTKEMAMNLVNLTGDMASFKNMRPDEIHLALTGAYTGETESLKRLGIVMLETNLQEFARQKGIKKTLKEMTQAEKVMLRYDYITANAKNSIGDFTRTQDSAANQMRIFTEGMKESGEKIGTIFLPVFTKIITFANKLMDRFRTLSPATQKLGVIIALVAAAIGPLLIVAGSLIGALGTIAGAVGAVGLPVIALVTGITALVGIIGKYLYSSGYLNKILEKTKNIFSILTVKFGIFKDMIGDGVSFIEALQWSIVGLIKTNKNLLNFLIFLRDAFYNIKKAVIELIPYIVTYAKNAFETLKTAIGFVKNVASDLAKVVLPWLRQMMVTIVPKIKDVAVEILKLAAAIQVRLKEAIKVIQTIWNYVWPLFAPVVASVFEHIKNTIGSALNIIKNVIKLVTSLIKGDWSGVWSAIKGIVVSVIKGIWTFLKSWMGIIKSVISSGLNAAKGIVGSILNSIKNTFKSIWNGIKGIVGDAVNWISKKVEWISGKVNTLKNIAKGAGKMVTDFGGWINPLDNFAEGTNSAPGGWSWVGENGPELMKVPMGSKIIPSDKSMAMASGSGITVVINNPNVWKTSDLQENIIEPMVKILQRKGVGSF